MKKTTTKVTTQKNYLVDFNISSGLSEESPTENELVRTNLNELPFHQVGDNGIE